MYHYCVQRLPTWPIWVGHISMVPWNGTNQQMESRIKRFFAFLCNDWRNPFLMTKERINCVMAQAFLAVMIFVLTKWHQRVAAHRTVSFFPQNSWVSRSDFSGTKPPFSGFLNRCLTWQGWKESTSMASPFLCVIPHYKRYRRWGPWDLQSIFNWPADTEFWLGRSFFGSPMKSKMFLMFF